MVNIGEMKAGRNFGPMTFWPITLRRQHTSPYLGRMIDRNVKWKYVLNFNENTDADYCGISLLDAENRIYPETNGYIMNQEMTVCMFSNL